MANFSESDDLTLLDCGSACRFFGGPAKPINPATLYRGVKAGRYPKPIKIGGRALWIQRECEDVVRQALVERDIETVHRAPALESVA